MSIIKYGVRKFRNVLGALNNASGNFGRTICESGETKTGRFSAVIPHNGLPTMSAVETLGEGIPSGILMTIQTGDFTSVSCTAGVVLCVNAKPENE